MKNKYDVVIIGAGIGGLVCGCYLAKTGVKVLIVEQHNKPGGYCTSFRREGFRFDVGVHYFGGIASGALGKILEELELNNQLTFNRIDPTDKIIMPDTEIFVRANYKDTIEGFKKKFPNEEVNIGNFFNFIINNNIWDVYKKTRGINFADFLNIFFKDYRLKAILSVLTGSMGTSPKEAAAFPCIALFRQYILDPGYYPRGGIQAFPNALVHNFKEWGGEFITPSKVVKIITQNRKVEGIILESGEKISSNIIVSNADASETFDNLLDVKARESMTIGKLITSPSMFIVYLGLNTDLRNKIGEDANIYYFSTYDIDEAFSKFENNILNDNINWIVCNFPSLHSHSSHYKKNTMTILTFAPYKTSSFWDMHKDIIAKKMIDRANKIVPNLYNSISLKIYATPSTLFKYTLNKMGAFTGWLSNVGQTDPALLPQKTSIGGLFLASHWCAATYLPHGGIPSVAFLGRNTSRLILETIGKKWRYEEIKL